MGCICTTVDEIHLSGPCLIGLLPHLCPILALSGSIKVLSWFLLRMSAVLVLGSLDNFMCIYAGLRFLIGKGLGLVF